MKKILGLVVALCTFQQLAMADHEKLETAAREIVMLSGSVMNGARRVIGTYPTNRQRYAYEHIQFLNRSASRFEQVLLDERAADRDHDHDQRIRQEYARLDHDTYYARRTFEDLFDARDHVDYQKLNRQLTQIERTVSDMGYNLP